MKKKGKLGKIIIIVVVVVILAAIFGNKGKDKNTAPANTNTANIATQNDGRIGGNTNDAPAPPENTPTPTENTAENKPDETKDKNYISPELKAFLESYEAYMDEYCDFLEHYDSSDAVQLVRYASLLQKYTDFAKKAEAYDESKMTDAEAIYYAEVLSRINIKLMKASQKVN